MNIKNKLSHRYFIYGYYGYGNYGDNLLLSAIIDNISSKCVKAEFVVRNLGPITLDFSSEKQVVYTNLDAILLNSNKYKVLRFFNYIIKNFSKIRDCDYFIFGGGTLLHATTSSSSLIILATLVALARINRIKVYGVGIGAMDLDGKMSRFIVWLIIFFSNNIGIRDDESLQLLPKSKKLRLTADLVYSWLSLNNQNVSINSQFIIAITLWSSPLKDELPFLKTLATALANFTKENILVRLLVFQHGESNSGGLSDLYSLEQLDAFLKDKGVNTEYIQLKSSKNEIISAFSNVKIHIGARYHANVISSILRIPFIGIDTEPKILSLCRKFGMHTIKLHDTDEIALQVKLTTTRDSIISLCDLQKISKLSKSNFDFIDKKS